MDEEEALNGEREELKDQVLDLLEQNPNGLKMAEIGEMLGTENWRSLIPVMKDLLDEGEATKENTTYYLT